MANIIAVSALNTYVKSLLEGDEFLQDIAIQGEISNFNRNYKSGHCYFRLKDDKASVQAVLFRGDAQELNFEPEDGMEVLARCRVSLYEQGGAFQLIVRDLFPHGVGAAQVAFEQLKKRLGAEGLFLEEHKQMLPASPACVGLITSKTGAALQDILKVAARRSPTTRFLLAPVAVQGAAAAEDIAGAIRRMDKDGRAQVIIVARGGGSAEDLAVFNAESIARAAFACRTPLVSAVGHEIDFTILDFVADLRAPTPSAAAEIVLPEAGQRQLETEKIFTQIVNKMQFRLNSWYNELIQMTRHPALLNTATRPDVRGQRLADLARQIVKAQHSTMCLSERRLQAAGRLAAGVNPYAILGRGYGMLHAHGQPARSVTQLATGDALEVCMLDGRLDCTVDAIHPQKESENAQSE